MAIKQGAWSWRDPIYNFNIGLIRSEHADMKRAALRLPLGFAAFMQERECFKPHPDAGDTTGALAAIGRGDQHNYYVAIWISTPRTVTVPECIRMVVHESAHATYRVLRTAGLFLTEESEEAYTYYQDWLVTESLRRLGVR